MTIRKRTLLILGVTLVGLMIGIYVTSSSLLLDSFARIEEREMAQNTQRVLDALRDRLDALNKTTRDYASWDDTYDFVQDGNAAYIESNLVTETFATNDLNLMLFVDNTGKLVYGQAIDLQNQQGVPIPPALLEQLAAGGPLVRHSGVDSQTTGILLLPEGPMLVASRPILTSEYAGPVRGALIMGRYLDAALVDKLAALTQLGLVLKRSDDPQPPADFQAMVPTLTEASPTRTQPLSADLFASYTLLKDVTGKPSLALRVDAPRPVYQQGQLSQQYFFWAALAIALIFSVLVFLLMERSVLSRLSRLTNAVNELAIDEDSAADPTKPGQAELANLARASDEIGRLAYAFNQMTDRTLSLIASLEQRVEARTALLRASTEVGRAAVSILDTGQLLREVINLITNRFGFYNAAVFLADGTGKWAVLREATGEAGRKLKERGHRLEVGGQSLVGSVMKSRQLRIAFGERAGDEVALLADPLLPNAHSEIALPLVVGSRVLGALDVQATQTAAFDEASAATLQAMADQVAIALSNAMQFQQTQAGLKRTQQLYGASAAISTSEDAVGIVNELMTRAVPDADAAQLFLYGPRDEAGRYAYLEVAACRAPQDSRLQLPVGTRVLPEQVLPISALASEPYIMRDASDPVVPANQQQIMQAMGMQAMLGYALVAGSQPVGLLLILYREPHMFIPAETQPLQALAGQIAVTLRNQQLVREQTLARQQLDEINRRLTGQVWQKYVRDRGEVMRKVDVGLSVSQDMSAPLSSELAVPVLIHGETIGRLRLEDVAPDREWTPTERALLQAVAGEVAIAIENARLIEQTQRNAQREQTISAITGQIYSTTDVKQLLQITAEELRRATGSARAVVRLGRASLQSNGSTIQPVTSNEVDAIPPEDGD